MKLLPLVLLSTLLALPALPQQNLHLPQASQAATVGQTVGLTNITISYHRPGAGGRKIFGGLVPYGVIWRTGANENTTISFSTAVKVEGQPLEAGTYALFMIPGEPQWTVVFNKFTGGWGTYNYDQSEDALRINVTPQKAEMHERLIYTFDDPAPSSTIVALRWDKTRVPFKVEVDLNATVGASITAEFRGGRHWDSASLASAARWELQQGHFDQALDYVNRSIDYGLSYSNLRLKGAILEKKGDTKGAAEFRERAKGLANDSEKLYGAYGLFEQKKFDEATHIANDYIAAHPGDYRGYSVLGDIYAAKDDRAKASEQYQKAMGVARNQTERTEVQDSINALGADVKH